ncbi:hypothetical protein [Halopelagius longus]|uniref:Uncharacterized protein n=1 Tax=Halopelagius longus TaxID=1236180 RepID=A0A370INK0_9EURY|nr:hypothetical protein [Halopelagius longus]RDI72246.1 hypothetical protein DWB78_11280 [Halopelagius longus]
MDSGLRRLAYVLYGGWAFATAVLVAARVGFAPRLDVLSWAALAGAGILTVVGAAGLGERAVRVVLSWLE